MQELELYVHIPFCVQKCAYCDFLSAPASDAGKAEYVDALKKEIQRYREIALSYQVSSVFVAEGLRPFCRMSRWRRFFKCCDRYLPWYQTQKSRSKQIREL